MAYWKYVHLVWVGTGTPVDEDRRYLEHWAALRGLGWTIYLWTDHPELGWIRALDRRDPARVGQNRFIETVDFTAPAIAAQMSRLVGATVWNEMLAVIRDINVLGEAIPFETQEIRNRDGNRFALANLRTPQRGRANREITETVATDPVAARILDAAGWFGGDVNQGEDFGAKRKLKSWGANYAAASDIVRAIALCLTGGFYTDISASPLPQEGVGGGLRGAAAGSAFNTIADENSETTVLWNGDAQLVNNAFLGASRPESAFWIYYFKSMHKIYKDLVLAPNAGALTTYFTARAAATLGGPSPLRFNQRKLDARITLAGSSRQFMYYMKRLAMRDLTLYCSGPYLLRACLDQYYVRNTRSLLTVEQLCAYVTARADAAKKRAMDALRVDGHAPVTFEVQNRRVKKIQRGSWDQSPVSAYFIEMFDQA